MFRSRKVQDENEVKPVSIDWRGFKSGLSTDSGGGAQHLQLTVEWRGDRIESGKMTVLQLNILISQPN